MKLEEMINPKTGKHYYYKDSQDHKEKYRKARSIALRLARKLKGNHGMLSDKEFISCVIKDILYNGLVINLEDWKGFDEEKTKRGFVYAIKNPVWSDKIKIGRTGNPEDRIRKLNTGDPDREYYIVGMRYFEDCHMAEHLAHEKAESVASLRQGEWFRLAKYEAINIIKEL